MERDEGRPGVEQVVEIDKLKQRPKKKTAKPTFNDSVSDLFAWILDQKLELLELNNLGFLFLMNPKHGVHPHCLNAESSKPG
jgi:hypothetical protein